MLLFFLFCYSFALSLNDIAFGIWTGIEMFETRMISLSKTWLQLVPEIHVYSDEIPLDHSMEIVNSSNHLNIIFHQIPMHSHHLIGTLHEGKWNSVQSRHLFAIVDLYKRLPNKTWYVLGDDDTFFFPNALQKFLSEQDPEIPKIYGFTYFVFDHLQRFFPKPNETHSFAQGGAGIVITKKLMSMISPYLPMCAEIYTGVNFASDMRLSACIQRFLNMTDDVFIFYPLLHSDTPIKSTSKDIYNSAPLSFHHVVPPITQQIWFASCTTWDDLYIDWSSIAMTELFIELGQEGNLVEIQWGFCIYCDINRNVKKINVTSQPEPIFEENDKERKNPRRFVQHFENNIVMETICDDSLSEYDILFDSFLLDKEGCVFRVKCPEVKKYIHNFQNGKSPLNITYEKEIEL